MKGPVPSNVLSSRRYPQADIVDTVPASLPSSRIDFVGGG